MDYQGLRLDYIYGGGSGIASGNNIRMSAQFNQAYPFSSGATTALERAKLVQSALLDITRIASEEMNAQRMYAGIHGILKRVVYAQNLFIASVNTSTQTLSMEYFVDDVDSFELDQLRQLPLEVLQRSLTGYMLQRNELLLLPRDAIEALIDSKQIQKLGKIPCQWLGVPLAVRGRCIGAMVLQSYEPQYTYLDDDLVLVQFIAQQIGLVMSIGDSQRRLQHAKQELENKVRERTRTLDLTVEVMRKNIEERKAVEQQLAFDAMHDGLTGLANRSLFDNRLQHALTINQRTEQLSGVIYLDLDRFKLINESRGHQIGDQLLSDVAARLKQALRPGDTIARLGGDEFCVLLASLESLDDAMVIAQRILDSLAKPFVFDDGVITTSASIGLAITSESGHDPKHLLRDADAAMYEAKRNGKKQICLFDAHMHRNHGQRMRIEAELQHAVGTEQIFMQYQPIIDLRSHRVAGFEALVRWNHPELGLISPAQFIPIAEESGSIHELGEQIIAEVCSALRKFSFEPMLKNRWVALNVSPVQIGQGDIAEWIIRTAGEFKARLDLLHVEVTETALVKNFTSAKYCFEKLNAAGVSLALDDFGTGYSSLKYIHEFPFDLIKVDRTFIISMERTSSLAIVETVAFLRDRLNIEVLAEGIEEQAQHLRLRGIGYDYAQGFLYSKPIDLDRLSEFVARFERAPPG